MEAIVTIKDEDMPWMSWCTLCNKDFEIKWSIEWGLYSFCSDYCRAQFYKNMKILTELAQWTSSNNLGSKKSPREVQKSGSTTPLGGVEPLDLWTKFEVQVKERDLSHFSKTSPKVRLNISKKEGVQYGLF